MTSTEMQHVEESTSLVACTRNGSRDILEGLIN